MVCAEHIRLGDLDGHRLIVRRIRKACSVDDEVDRPFDLPRFSEVVLHERDIWRIRILAEACTRLFLASHMEEQPHPHRVFLVQIDEEERNVGREHSRRTREQYGLAPELLPIQPTRADVLHVLFEHRAI